MEFIHIKHRICDLKNSLKHLEKSVNHCSYNSVAGKIQNKSSTNDRFKHLCLTCYQHDVYFLSLDRSWALLNFEFV